MSANSTQLVLFIVTIVATIGLDAVATDLADPDRAVEVTREALSDVNPNWYDEAADGVGPINAQPPRVPRRSNRSDFGFADVLLYLGWTLLALALAWLVYVLARAFLRTETREAAVADDTTSHHAEIMRVDELPVALATAPADYLNEAERHYRRGDFAQAAIYLFSHQLLQLDRQHWVRLVKGKTNRQYLREIRRSSLPAGSLLAATFEQTVAVFEEAFFGKRAPDATRFEACWQAASEFDTLVQQTQEQAA